MSISKINLKLTLLVSFLCLLFVGKVNAYTVVKPTSDFYVNDYAHVLNESLKNNIQSKSIKLYEEKKVQLVVLTVSSLDGIPINDYANTYYNENEIGSKERDGILILLSTSDRSIRVEVGDHLEGDLPDGKVGRIIDEYAMSYLEKSDWNNGIESLYNVLYEFLNTGENIKIEGEIDDADMIYVLYGVIASAVMGLLVIILKKFIIPVFIVVNGIEFYILVIRGSFNALQFLGIIFVNLMVALVVYGLLFGRHDDDGYRGGHSSGGSSYSGGGGHSSGGGASRNF